MRKCNLNLAPEAPWRCPEDCGSYERRLADVNWAHGTLVTPPAPEEPVSLGEDDSVADLLNEAANIVNSVGSETLAEVQSEQAEAARRDATMMGKLRNIFRRK